MRKNLIIAVMIVIISACMAFGADVAKTYTYKQLVERYIDLQRLADLPQQGEKAAMCSSYDRASTYDEATGKYIKWDANGDGGGFIRKEGDKFVIAEMEGPGCIFRIWSADAQAGHVRIFLDGSTEPAIDMPFGQYFRGEKPPFNFKSLGYVTSAGGFNLYLPIPYQKSCKITADEKWGAYYQFTYTTFPKGTTVPTFKLDMPQADLDALKWLDDFLTNKIGENPKAKSKDEKTVEKTAKLEAGKSIVLADISGERAITAIKCKMDIPERNSQMMPMRELVLKITWDDQKTPAVWCPLGDFFGTAPAINLYKSLPLGMTKDGFYCYWYMPFAKKAVVELVNEGKSAYEAQFTITHAPLGRKFDGLGYFHAKWHRDLGPNSEDRKIDWTVLQTKGKGRFVGMMLHVWNKYGGWWGEGDEKFFVDGEKFPSTLGTGSEDYFGYAWSSWHLFERPFHGQSMTMRNIGHQTVHRWQVTDDVPFQTSFDAYIEKYSYDRPSTAYACVPVWYLSPYGEDSYGAVPVAERISYYVWPPESVAGFTLMNYPVRGEVSPQDMKGQQNGKWVGDEQLFWPGGWPGDFLNLAWNVEKTGKYKIETLFTKARDYGIVEVYLDDKKISEQIDLYNENVVPTGPIDLGIHQIEKGKHKFSIKIVGANEKTAKDQHIVGLDEIVLTPAE